MRPISGISSATALMSRRSSIGVTSKPVLLSSLLEFWETQHTKRPLKPIAIIGSTLNVGPLRVWSSSTNGVVCATHPMLLSVACWLPILASVTQPATRTSQSSRLTMLLAQLDAAMLLDSALTLQSNVTIVLRKSSHLIWRNSYMINFNIISINETDPVPTYQLLADGMNSVAPILMGKSSTELLLVALTLTTITRTTATTTRWTK